MTKHQTVREILDNFYYDTRKAIKVYRNDGTPRSRMDFQNEATQFLKDLVTEMVEEIIGIPNYETYEQNVIAQFQHEIRQRAKVEIERRFE